MKYSRSALTVYIVRMLSLMLIFSVFVYSIIFQVVNIIQPIYAGTGGTCNDPTWCIDCGPENKKGYHECGEDESGETICCYSECSGGYTVNCHEVSFTPGCGNCAEFCRDPTTITPTPTTTPTPTVTPTCSCSGSDCPTPTPESKFRKAPVSNGDHLVCDPTDPCILPTTVACPPSYVNSPPVCAMLPSSIALVRGESSTNITLSAHDDDYGDPVAITGFNVEGNDGLLKNCVNITKTDGGSIFGTVIKPGSEDASPVYDGTISIKVDQNAILGVYDNVGGQSMCQGKLNVEISDYSPEQGDTTAYTTCSIDVSVTNSYPRFEGAEMFDRGTPTSRGGNIIPDRGPTIYIGSNSGDTRRVLSTCKTQVDQTGLCPVGQSEIAYSTSNPFDFSFTISDANGVDDILEAGIWLQKYGQSNTSPRFPVAQGGSRNSIQALYSDRRDNEIGPTLLKYFNTPGCTRFQTSGCVPTRIDDAGLGLFSAIVPITQREKPGNISQSPYRASALRQWLELGFPSCLYLNLEGCGVESIPAGSLIEADNDYNNGVNYNWSIKAGTNEQLCYLTDGTSQAVSNTSCPTDCVACIEKRGITEVASIPNSFKFDYRIKINDKNVNNAGLDDGEYIIFIHASDKVNAQINNGGYWGKLDGEGHYCEGTACSSELKLVYDITPPTMGNVLLAPIGGGGINLSTTFSDSNGIFGVANRPLYKVKDGILTGFLHVKDSPENLFDGQNDMVSTHSTEFSFDGYGMSGGNLANGSICVADNAFNMTCGTNSEPLEAKASWLKTSMGDVYSKRSDGGTAFAMTLPASNQDASATLTFYEKVIAPFSEQTSSIVTGMVVTGGIEFGVNGGRSFDGDVNSYPFGSAIDEDSAAPGKSYRTNQVGTPLGELAWRGFVDRAPQSTWYPALRDIVSRRCDVLGDCNTSDNDISLISNSENKYKIIVINQSTSITSPLVCNGVNIIFVENGSTLTVEADITKYNPASGCLFIVSPNSSITIKDPSSEGPLPGHSDKFEASVVVTSAGGNGGTFQTVVGPDSATRYDRLDIYGFIYSTATTPLFGRDLVFEDNSKYPAEWIIYDANVLDNYREILGITRSYDIVCGTSSSIFCQ